MQNFIFKLNTNIKCPTNKAKFVNDYFVDNMLVQNTLDLANFKVIWVRNKSNTVQFRITKKLDAETNNFVNEVEIARGPITAAINYCIESYIANNNLYEVEVKF